MWADMLAITANCACVCVCVCKACVPHPAEIWQIADWDFKDMLHNADWGFYHSDAPPNMSPGQIIPKKNPNCCFRILQKMDSPEQIQTELPRITETCTVWLVEVCDAGKEIIRVLLDEGGDKNDPLQGLGH